MLFEVLFLINERDLDVLDHRELRDEIVRLENEAESFTANARKGVIVHLSDFIWAEKILSGGRSIEASEDVEQSRLP